MGTEADDVSTIDWNSLIFEAERKREQFSNVTIITLFAYAEEMLYELALSNLNSDQHPNKIKQIVNQQLKEGLWLSEFVQINANRITVGINENIIEDSHNTRVLNMLSTISDFSPGKQYLFGEPIFIQRYII